MMYSFLAQQYTEGRFTIVPLREQDMELIRVWRNKQISVLRQKFPLSTEQQQTYYQTVVKPLFFEENPSQILFSLLRDGECIGYGGLVHISWLDKRAELSFLMDPVETIDQTNYEQVFSVFISLMKKVLFTEMGFNRLFTETYAFRTHHIATLEQNSFIREGVLRQQIILDGNPMDSIIHSILKQEYHE